MARASSHIASPAAHHSHGVLNAQQMQQCLKAATDHLLLRPLHSRYTKVDNDLSLSDAPGYAELGSRLEPLARDTAAAHLAFELQRISGAITDAAEAGCTHALQQWCVFLEKHWHTLWPNKNDIPCLKVDIPSIMEERVSDAAYDTLFPPFTISHADKNTIYNKALNAAFNARYEDMPLKKHALMADNALIEAIELALHHQADNQFRSAQNRMVVPRHTAPSLDSKNPTYADARHSHRRLQRAIRKNRQQPVDALPPDLYDIYAELEARIGTGQTGPLGEVIYDRFMATLTRELESYKTRHNLDVPFYYQGREPQLG